ncbi:MAG: extracellular solute-binding protein [Pseudomonadota bacterium]
MTTPTLKIAIRKFTPFEDAIRKQFADFRTTQNVDCALHAESLDLDPLTEAMFDQGGLKNGDWDIGFIVTDWLPMASAGGHILDLAPLFDANPVPNYPEAWSPSLTGMQRIGDRLFGLPYHDGPQCLIYRKDMFADPAHRQAFQRRHGRPLAIPDSWDDYLDVVAYFSRAEEDRYGTVLAAFPDGHNAVYDFCIHLWTRGGELVDSNGKPTLATEPAAAALDFYRALAKRGGELVHPHPQEIDSVKSGEIFAEGRIALMTNWFGFAAYAASYPESKVRGLVDVAPIPRGTGGDAVSLNVYWVLAIGSGSRHPELAYRFIKHCLTPPMDKITTIEGAIGCRLSTWRDPEVNALVPFYNKLGSLHEKARQLPFDQRFPALAHIIDHLVTEAIEGDAASTTLLARAQAEAEQAFAPGRPQP